MKHLILIISFIAIICNLSAQEYIDTIFFDSTWKEVKSDDFVYYRVVKEENNLFHVTDYRKSGEIQMTGRYISEKFESREGEFIWFHKNGNKSRLTNFSNNQPIGYSYEYDKQGNLILRYIADIKSLDNAKSIIKHIRKFRKHLYRKIKYPKYCYNHNIDGKVVVDFVINKEGKAVDYTISKAVHDQLDAEAIRIIEAYNKWPVPVYKEKETIVKLRIPVVFTL